MHLRIICFIKSICENINARENYMFYYLVWKKKNVLKIRRKTTRAYVVGCLKMLNESNAISPF
jgi:hypothetical protein